jgi:hypothetical protein
VNNNIDLILCGKVDILCLVNFKEFGDMVKRVSVFEKIVIISLLFMFLVPLSFGALVEADLDSEIWFEVSELSQGRWEYTYDVSNINIMEGIYEFTIYFPDGPYDGLAVETDGVLAAEWDEIVWEPIDSLGIAGGYDALAEAFAIDPAMTTSGFSVSFDWLGEGAPGSQYYEIVNPDTFETIDTGWTIPEPCTLLLLGLSALLGRRKRN